MISPSEGLHRGLRLRKSADFRRIQGRGRRWRGRNLVVMYEPNHVSAPRVGLVVSRKVGNAVHRNRVKRWLREASRRHLDALPGVDVVLIARTGAAQAGFACIATEVGRALDSIRQELA